MPFRPAGRMLFCAAAALAVAPALAGEPALCVAGTVLNAATGEPVRRAAVTIPQSAMLTDASGAFRFCGLPAGFYPVNAEKPGFVADGARVAVGPSREDVLLRLQPLSAVTGKVLNDAGEPLAHVLVQLLSIHLVDGRRKVRVEFAVATDDRGQYRIPGLTPARYYLRAAGWDAAPDADANEAFAPVYYGGAGDVASASPVTIEPGRDLRADFSVNLQRAYRIYGTIAGYSPLVPAQIELIGAGGEPSAAPVTVDSSTGKFRVDAVVAGSYTLRAAQEEGPRPSRGEVPLQVNADLPGVVVPLAGAVVLHGTVRMAEDSAQSDLPSPNCSVRLSPADAWSPAEARLGASTEPTGEFEIVGVPAGQYTIRMDCAGGYPSAVRMGDADLVAGGELRIPSGTDPPPVEAVLATDGGRLGVAASPEGESGPAWVLLLPVAGSALHVRMARLSRRVRNLDFTGVAPGDYQVYAWTGSPEAFAYADPEARQIWAGRAVSVHIAPRERQNITVKVGPGETP